MYFVLNIMLFRFSFFQKKKKSGNNFKAVCPITCYPKTLYIHKSKNFLLLCWYIKRKTRVRIAGQASKRNMKKKYIFGDFSTFLAKTLKLKFLPAIKIFLKNLSLGIDFELWVSPRIYKISAHKREWKEKKGSNPD